VFKNRRKQLNAPICIVAPLFWVAKTNSTEIGTKTSKIPKNDYSKKRFKFFRNTHESVKRDDLNMQTTIGKVLVSIKTNTGVPRKVAIGGEIQTPNIYTFRN